MIAEGIITADQPNPSYDGSDAAWVADGGNFFQQGFATNEIYKYENDIDWKDGAPADVSFYTVGELGFENYPAAITMLKSRADELDSCLTELVPMMQQAWIDFLNDPKPITDAMISINETHDGFWSLERGPQRGRPRAHRVRRLRRQQPRRHLLQLRPGADAGAVRHPAADLRRPGHRDRRQCRRSLHEQVLRRRARPLTSTLNN